MPSSQGVEYTLKRTCFGKSVLYVREARPAESSGVHFWGPWRRAGLQHQAAAVRHLQGLNKP